MARRQSRRETRVLRSSILMGLRAPPRCPIRTRDDRTRRREAVDAMMARVTRHHGSGTPSASDGQLDHPGRHRHVGAYYEQAAGVRADSWIPLYNVACLRATTRMA